jgi:LPS-assembly protein
MTPGARGRSQISLVRALLLTGAAVGAFATSPALAQSEGPVATRDATQNVPHDGLGEDGVWLIADEIERDDANDRVIARGDVEARYQGRSLRAQQVVYDVRTGVATASGDAVIVNPDGSVQYAQSISLDEEATAGVATDFRARIDERQKLAAATAIRRSETVNELNRAIYTPCEICKAPEGEPKTPTWSIQADKVVQDQGRRVVYYRNATLKLFGAPVFFAPVFWHPDPSVERASGLLTPKFDRSDRRGVVYEQPYLWLISPYQDLVISPQFMTKHAPFVDVEHRKRFWSGRVRTVVGGTYERPFDRKGDQFGDRAWQSYILSDGDFDLENAWRWGFTAERASDKGLFDRYDVGDVFEQRGLYTAEDRRLMSQAYLVRQTDRSYLSVTAFGWQGLRPVDNILAPTSRPDDVRLLPIYEDDRRLPVVAPRLEARWRPDARVAGGRLNLQASAVALFRDQDAGDLYRGRRVSLDPRVETGPGTDTARASAQAEWRRPLTTGFGLRIEPFLDARGDYYRVSQYRVADPTAPTGFRYEDGSAAFGRGNATAGVDLSYPLIRASGRTTIVLEPMLQAAISPDAEIDPRQTVEDSLTFELDEANLFRVNKFPGFDLYEGGARLNAGGRASVNWGPRRDATLFLGRSFRSEQDFTFPANSGLRETASDWITAGTFTLPNLTAYARARLDGDTGALKRGEVGANASWRRANGFFRYFVDESRPFTRTSPLDFDPRIETLDVGAEVFVTRRFGFTVLASRDFNFNIDRQEAGGLVRVRDEARWRRSEIGLLYQDDCARIEVVYERDESNPLGVSNQVSLRLNFVTLSGQIYGLNSR